jgi:hypothetical protein
MNSTKVLPMIAALLSSFGVFLLTGCDSCSNKVEPPPPPVTCGPGTVAQGGQCVGTSQQR